MQLTIEERRKAMCNLNPKMCGGRPTEVFSRVTGFYRPTRQYNKGKTEEYLHRKNYVLRGEETHGE